MAPRGTTARSRNARINWVLSLMPRGYHPHGARGERHGVKPCKKKDDGRGRRSLRLAAPVISVALFRPDFLSLLDRRHAFVLTLVVIVAGERDLVAGLQGLELFDGLVHHGSGLLFPLLVLDRDLIVLRVDGHDGRLHLMRLARRNRRSHHSQDQAGDEQSAYHSSQIPHGPSSWVKTG